MILPADTPKVVLFVDELTGKVLATCREDGHHEMSPDLTPAEQRSLFDWIISGNLREAALLSGGVVATIPCHVDRAHDGTMLRFKAIMSCETCQDVRWVCENHPTKAWGEMIDGKDTETACCCGAGAPCVCSPLHQRFMAITEKLEA